MKLIVYLCDIIKIKNNMTQEQFTTATNINAEIKDIIEARHELEYCGQWIESIEVKGATENFSIELDGAEIDTEFQTFIKNEFDNFLSKIQNKFQRKFDAI